MIGELIAERREARGLTQERLARRCGVSTRTVQRWEAGESRPRNSHLLRVCKELGIDPGELA